MIKYYLKTYNKLPRYKKICSRKNDAIIVLTKMMHDKPATLSVNIQDIRESMFLFTIDTEKVPEYQKIFRESKPWSWKQVLEDVAESTKQSNSVEKD